MTGSKDMCIKKWTLGQEVLESNKVAVASSVALSSSHTEKAHEKDINSMCVSANGKLIATGSQDKTAKVRPNMYLTDEGNFILNSFNVINYTTNQ